MENIIETSEDKPLGQVIAIVDYYTHSGTGPFTVDSYIYGSVKYTIY